MEPAETEELRAEGRRERERVRARVRRGMELWEMASVRRGRGEGDLLDAEVEVDMAAWSEEAVAVIDVLESEGSVGWAALDFDELLLLADQVARGCLSRGFFVHLFFPV